MSGSTVGGIVGGAIGFVASGFNPVGAQIGFTIGSAVGAYVDPVQVRGPRLSDSMAQTSTVGGVIPFGYGRYVTGGNIVWCDRLIEHVKRQRQGKGASSKTTTYTYTRSYAVGVCQGEIYGFLWIKRNGKKVYTSDPAATAEEKAYSSKWLQKVTLYRGGESQMPDSTIVAVEGAGNVSPFRGLAYIVVENDDLTDLSGAIPQYEFCVVATPPEAYLTSHPYTQYFEDSASITPMFGGASSRALLIELEVDSGQNETFIRSDFYGAMTREALWPFAQYPEMAHISPLFNGAYTKQVFISHTQPPEDFYQIAPLFNGALTRQVLLTNTMRTEVIGVAPLFNGASTS
ncbi:hypothetical protein [uncultured Stenotrophomonas sp.]|uniref:hypothetical protein n=1 Tax=uncultured Stenotrophomonas sp. TaxID=165438 RepID=UPI0025DAE4D2|nr:hypothetical protein [uncultured Stenotrophomonas sp.]